MGSALFTCVVTLSLLGPPLALAVFCPQDFWRCAGKLKRWLREDYARKYGSGEADELLGPPLPYEFFEQHKKGPV